MKKDLYVLLGRVYKKDGVDGWFVTADQQGRAIGPYPSISMAMEVCQALDCIPTLTWYQPNLPDTVCFNQSGVFIRRRKTDAAE